MTLLKNSCWTEEKVNMKAEHRFLIKRLFTNILSSFIKPRATSRVKRSAGQECSENAVLKKAHFCMVTEIEERFTGRDKYHTGQQYYQTKIKLGLLGKMQTQVHI